MAENEKRLPYSIGQFSGGWLLVIGLLLALIVVGAYAYSQQFTEGESVTGLRNIGTMKGVTWGLYVAMYIYLIGLSFAGITLAVLTRIFQWDSLKPVSRIAELLAVVAIISGGLLIIADVGQPIRAMKNLFMYARPQSPLFGTFTLVIAGELFAGFVYFFLEGRRDAAIMARKGGRFEAFYRLWASGYKDTKAEKARRETSSFWLAIGILPLMVAAFSTVGFVFGLQVGRPGWFSALQAPGFIVLATLSGIGFLAVIAAILRKQLGAEKILDMKTFRAIAIAMISLNLIYVYFMIIEWLSSFYSAQQTEVVIANALISGDYSQLYWLTLALLILSLGLLVYQFISGRYSIAMIAVSGVLVNFAAIGRRYLIVVPSQTHGQLLPYGIASYNPTWIEYAVVFGLMAFSALIFVLFIKVFPVFKLPEITEGGA